MKKRFRRVGISIALLAGLSPCGASGSEPRPCLDLEAFIRAKLEATPGLMHRFELHDIEGAEAALSRTEDKKRSALTMRLAAVAPTPGLNPPTALVAPSQAGCNELTLPTGAKFAIDGASSSADRLVLRAAAPRSDAVTITKLNDSMLRWTFDIGRRDDGTPVRAVVIDTFGTGDIPHVSPTDRLAAIFATDAGPLVGFARVRQQAIGAESDPRVSQRVDAPAVPAAPAPIGAEAGPSAEIEAEAAAAL